MVKRVRRRLAWEPLPHTRPPPPRRAARPPASTSHTPEAISSAVASYGNYCCRPSSTRRAWSIGTTEIPNRASCEQCKQPHGVHQFRRAMRLLMEHLPARGNPSSRIRKTGV